ncbi:hypothetical protein [Rubrivirga sp. IMCC43871]|uniref:hypothetical protein n=1 Tax=Rubrivirga sp. IMCC43871 TaxID=3391575 RepID=UPI00399037AC
MTPAANALLDGLIDYAGLFPPADLDLGAAVEAYARHRVSPHAEMLGRFIVPAARLGALDEHAEALGSGAPWRFSVLGLAPADGEAWTDTAARTVEAARAFQARHGGAAVCDRFEIRLPADLARDHDALAGALLDLDAEMRAGASSGPRAAVEVPFLDAPDAVEPAAAAVAETNARAGRPAVALKFRCGGVTPDLVPKVETLATALAAAVRADAPFKATAGLHHPLPNHDDAVGARMYGFLGVFGGAALARVHGLGADDLAEMLDDADASSWAVGDALRWRSLSASAAEVADAREQLALSFGSCSFDEPVDDLQSLGWLAPGA